MKFLLSSRRRTTMTWCVQAARAHEQIQLTVRRQERALEKGPVPPSPMRDFLIRQIKMLAAHLSKQRGVANVAPLLPDPEDRAVLRQVLGEGSACAASHTSIPTSLPSRPVSARIRPETAASGGRSRSLSRPSTASSRPESTASRGSTGSMTMVVEAVQARNPMRQPTYSTARLTVAARRTTLTLSASTARPA